MWVRGAPTTGSRTSFMLGELAHTRLDRHTHAMASYPNNMTDDLIRDFQDGADDVIPAQDWSGQLLLPDGDLGPRTEWALALADLPRLRSSVMLFGYEA